MQLKRLTLRNFRAFKQADWDLPPSGLVLVIGANNAGKSALLSSLDALVAPSSRNRFATAPEPAELLATFSLSADERTVAISQALDPGGEPDPLVAQTGLLQTVELKFSEIGDSLVLTRVGVSDRGGSLSVMATVEDSRLLAISLHEVIRKGVHGRSWQLTERVSGSPEVAVQRLAELTELPTFAQLLADWRRTLFHFNAIRLGTQSTRTLQSTEELAPGGENLPEALLYLNTNRHPAWDNIRAVMQDVVPDIGLLETFTRGSEVEAVFVDPFLHVPQNLKRLGTGVEQLLMTAYVGERHPPGGIVIVEEPESHLHPEAQRRLLSHLVRWSAHRLIIVSTHSTVFLDRAAGQVPTWLVDRAEGVSTVRRSRPHLPDVLAAVGVRLSDVITADRVLVVEGDPDADVLRWWYGDLLDSRRVRVVPGRRGGDPAFHIETFAEWLETWVGQENPDFAPLLFIRDRDELEDGTIRRLEDTGAVAVLPRRELENYLLEPGAIQKVLEELLTAGGLGTRPPSEAEIANRLRFAADSLKPVIVLKRVAEALAPVRLIDRQTVRELIQGGDPTLDTFLAEVSSRLPVLEEELQRLKQRWRDEEAEIDNRWPTDWSRLAPGADVLSAVWKEVGLSFTKGRDPLLIAQQLPAPPELSGVLGGLLGEASMDLVARQ